MTSGIEKVDKYNQIFSEKLVCLNLPAGSQEEVIRTLGDLLVQHGFITGQYIAEVIEREKEVATGLPTKPYGVAIPHAGSANVLKTGVAVGVLSAPVSFKVMGTESDTVGIDLVFLLAVKDPDDQIDMLCGLVQLFRRQEILESIYRETEVAKIVAILQSEIKAEFNLNN